MAASKSRPFKPNLVVLPDRRMTRIEQREIVHVVFLQNQIWDLKRELEESAAKLLERLQAGADREPGAHRAARQGKGISEIPNRRNPFY